MLSPNFINLNKFYRPQMSEPQKLFFVTLVPVAYWIQEQTHMKCHARTNPVPTKYGIFASIIAAHCILKSDWGTHPVCQDRVYLDTKNWVHGNNFWLKEAGDVWKRDVVAYKRKVYRSYQDWGAFAIDMSDSFGWQDDYKDVLAASRLPDQLNLMSKRDENPESYRSRIGELITRYGLWEFDYRD